MQCTAGACLLAGLRTSGIREWPRRVVTGSQEARESGGLGKADMASGGPDSSTSTDAARLVPEPRRTRSMAGAGRKEPKPRTAPWKNQIQLPWPPEHRAFQPPPTRVLRHRSKRRRPASRRAGIAWVFRDLISRPPDHHRSAADDTGPVKSLHTRSPEGHEESTLIGILISRPGVGEPGSSAGDC